MPSPPAYTTADFLAGMQRLLPTGPVWPRDADAVQTQVLAALVQLYVANADSAANLLADAFPVAPVMLLPEWQETLGLPDPCAGPTATLQQEQQQVAARFVAGGGQSINYLVSVAAALGYSITIAQFAPFRFGQTFGQPMNGEAWAFAWQITSPSATAEPFRFGRDNFGEPFTEYGSTVLQCEMQRLAPAHTALSFLYGYQLNENTALNVWTIS